MKIKVIIDTNVAVSGLLWKGAPNDILRLAREGEIELCCTSFMIDELQKVLYYERLQERMKAIGVTQEELIDYYQDIVTAYDENSCVDIIKADDTDNKFIAAALDSGAYIIVSGDRHLLDLKEHRKVQILTPVEFLYFYQELKAKGGM
ncbi:MAG: putative toxin-antitoxin system toxin component, PIN family [Nitrospirota bacterium]